MIQKSTLQLLRFHFSFFLMPVFWFALTQTPNIDIRNAVLVFAVLHLLVYPASNGYNSYMDRDQSSIGGVEHPLQPTLQLFYFTLMMDIIALAVSFYISLFFAWGVLLYILASRAYSYRGIRLKQYPIVGFLTVILFQGSWTFWLVYHGSGEMQPIDFPVNGMVIASLLIGGVYPLTQIYQHEADKADGVRTLSYVLGYKGTFIFSGILYSLAMFFLGYTFIATRRVAQLLILSLFLLPIFIYFLWWGTKVWKNVGAADFKHTMRMNGLASLFTNLGFLTVLIINHLE